MKIRSHMIRKYIADIRPALLLIAASNAMLAAVPIGDALASEKTRKPLSSNSSGSLTRTPTGLLNIALSPTRSGGDDRMRNNIRGLIVPRHHATISSRLQATITAIGPDNGERFNKGDSLVAFDCAIFNAELKRAEAQLNAAKDTRNVKAKLASNGTISKLQLVLAKADEKKAEAEHVLSKEQATHCIIRAPYDGRVVKRLANAHETVNFGDPLVEIVNDREVELQLYAPSRWLKKLQIGKQFRFHVDETDTIIHAKIIATGAWIDNVSQLVEVRAICTQNGAGLVAGMSGRAELEHLQ